MIDLTDDQIRAARHTINKLGGDKLRRIFAENELLGNSHELARAFADLGARIPHGERVPQMTDEEAAERLYPPGPGPRRFPKGDPADPEVQMQRLYDGGEG